MSSTTVRLDKEVRNKLKEIAEKEGVSIQFVVKRALDFYQKHLFLQDLNDSYAKAGKYEKDILWDSVLNDGLDDEDWNENGELLKKGIKNA